MEGIEKEKAPGKKPLKQVERELQDRGFMVIDQAPGQMEIDIDGQKVELPFTNAFGMKAILYKGGGKWVSVCRSSNKDDLERDLRALYEGE